MMKLFVAGLSYKTAPVQVREKLAIAPARLRCLGCRLMVGASLSELVVVSTCNRVEVYGVSSWARAQVQRLFSILSDSDFDFTPFLYVKEGAEAVRHLFTVASGLDSMVLGETEITGQVKQAYQAACEAGFTGRITNKLFQEALSVAKKIRTDTQVGRGSTSVGSVAVDLAERIFDGDLTNKTVMIVGAGKMGEACVRHLAKKGAKSVLVLNRSMERAEALANEFGGRGMALSELPHALLEADIVVSSTGAVGTILSRQDLVPIMSGRRNRPLFLVDIAVPRDIAADVEQLSNVYLYNVDHLEQIVRENVKQREHELVRCEQILAERVASLMARWASASARKPSGSRDDAWALLPSSSPLPG